MDIEHCSRLSWYLRRGESHEQDGEKLLSAAMPQTETASSDPAMAFEPSVKRRAIIRPVFLARQRPRCRMNSGFVPVSASNARHAAQNRQRRIPSRSIKDL
jgi:hypothetical protein